MKEKNPLDFIRSMHHIDSIGFDTIANNLSTMKLKKRKIIQEILTCPTYPFPQLNSTLKTMAWLVLRKCLKIKTNYPSTRS